MAPRADRSSPVQQLVGAHVRIRFTDVWLVWFRSVWHRMISNAALKYPNALVVLGDQDKHGLEKGQKYRPRSCANYSPNYFALPAPVTQVQVSGGLRRKLSRPAVE